MGFTKIGKGKIQSITTISKDGSGKLSSKTASIKDLQEQKKN